MKVCGDCRYMHGMAIGAGIHECHGPNSWHWVWPDERQWVTGTGREHECADHDTGLRAQLTELARAFQHNAMAVRINSGSLNGRILPEGFVYDPTIPAKPAARKRKATP